jgi:hypothetical protein
VMAAPRSRRRFLAELSAGESGVGADNPCSAANRALIVDTVTPACNCPTMYSRCPAIAGHVTCRNRHG